ncbi:hypothetical protein F4823DRAFT_590986 [Ustulina deusta]|nr:hypothetical protein F4823DRAFT_590986 [Ustulina deusta]
MFVARKFQYIPLLICLLLLLCIRGVLAFHTGTFLHALTIQVPIRSLVNKICIFTTNTSWIVLDNHTVVVVCFLPLFTNQNSPMHPQPRISLARGLLTLKTPQMPDLPVKNEPATIFI